MPSHNDLLSDLTAAQRQAVTHTTGPLLVLAGPGSGKTRVITHRVAHLIAQGVQPRHILAITFTNKAADEMRQRVAKLHSAGGCTICTFHSLAARLLREFADQAQLPGNFSIYDTPDQRTALRDALKACQYDPKNYTPDRMLDQISTLKNDLKTPEQAARQPDGFLGEVVAKLYQAYQKQLQENGAVDFDDLLMKLALLLRDQPDLRDQLNDRYQYVLVDEYQDTNQCQYQIARGLSLNHHNLCVTGDPDQSIYRWRGADIGNILAFESDYADAKVVRLEENFRSTPQILDQADRLIRANQQRKQKRLFTNRPDGTAPELAEYQDESAEAQGMIDWIGRLRSDGFEYRDVAVCYRINSLSRVLEEALRRENIPYQIVRGLEFFSRREIKDMLAYLRILVNPADRVSLKRIINRPTRGIGATTVQRLFEYSNRPGKDIWQVLNNVEQVATLAGAAQKKVKQFAELIVGMQAKLTEPVELIARAVYAQSGLAQALAAENSQEAQANVEELISSAVQYDMHTPEGSLIDYLQQIALLSDADGYDEKAGAVSLMTLHAAKGLEFPAVLIIGAEDGLIPHRRSLESDEALEEERRLLFVGMTRAQQKLAVSRARWRMIQGATLATVRSEFLRDLTGWDHREVADDDDQTSDNYEYDDYYDQTADFPAGQFAPGQWVRHPTLGLGRVASISPHGRDCRAVVQFGSGQCKTLMLKYAHLEAVDPGR